MKEENILHILLAHATYSFSEINWDFDQLTMREKCLIKSQENLNKIKDLCNTKLIYNNM